MFLKHTWPAFTCALIILILSAIPGQELPKVQIINIDKLVHAIMFAFLTILLAKGFSRQTVFEFTHQHYLLTSVLCCILYGGLIEILQATVCINRAGDWFDFLWDAIGSIIGASVIHLKQKQTIQKEFMKP